MNKNEMNIHVHLTDALGIRVYVFSLTCILPYIVRCLYFIFILKFSSVCWTF